VTSSARSAPEEVPIPEKTTKVTFKTDVEGWKPQLARLCTRGFTPERILAGALHAGLKNPTIFECEPKSIFLALAKCCRLALDIGEGIDLVPLNNTVRGKKILQLEAWPGYKGLKALGIRERVVRSMQEFCVYQNDQFDHCLGLDARLTHIPSLASLRGGLKGAYSIIRLPGGEKTFHYMPIEDIEIIRAKSRSWGPKDYTDCPDWYAMKTVVRDYLNRQPQTGALQLALRSDDSEQPDDEDMAEAPRAIAATSSATPERHAKSQVPIRTPDGNGEVHQRPRLESGEPVPEVIDQSKQRRVSKDHPWLDGRDPCDPDQPGMSPEEQAELSLAEDRRIVAKERADAEEGGP